MVELLIIMAVETKDALLEAINQEFVEAVELLLEHEELIHKEGEHYVSFHSPFTPAPSPSPDIMLRQIQFCSLLAVVAESRHKHRSFCAGNHASYLGGPQEQLRDNQAVAGSWRNAAPTPRRKVSVR